MISQLNETTTWSEISWPYLSTCFLTAIITLACDIISSVHLQGDKYRCHSVSKVSHGQGLFFLFPDNTNSQDACGVSKLVVELKLLHRYGSSKVGADRVGYCRMIIWKQITKELKYGSKEILVQKLNQIFNLYSNIHQGIITNVNTT